MQRCLRSLNETSENVPFLWSSCLNLVSEKKQNLVEIILCELVKKFLNSFAVCQLFERASPAVACKVQRVQRTSHTSIPGTAQ